MHVCLVTLDFPPFRGSGLTVYAEHLVEGLVSYGHQVTVLAARRRESERREASDLLPEVRVIRFPVGPADWMALGWQAARFLHSHSREFDLVHFADVHFAYAYRGPFLASGVQSFRQRLSSHGGRTYHVNRRNLVFRTLYYSAARRLMERSAVRRAQHVVMISKATQQAFVEEYRLAPERTSVIYIGIDAERFARLPARAAARRALGLADDLPVLLYVGFSTPRKGVEYLAQALSQMQSPAQLLMVGNWEKGLPRALPGGIGQRGGPGAGHRLCARRRAAELLRRGRHLLPAQPPGGVRHPAGGGHGGGPAGGDHHGQRRRGNRRRGGTARSSRRQPGAGRGTGPPGRRAGAACRHGPRRAGPGAGRV
jgi:glycosyltransferase involved in cell wall biosynthesis